MKKIDNDATEGIPEKGLTTTTGVNGAPPKYRVLEHFTAAIRYLDGEVTAPHRQTAEVLLTDIKPGQADIKALRERSKGFADRANSDYRNVYASYESHGYDVQARRGQFKIYPILAKIGLKSLIPYDTIEQHSPSDSPAPTEWTPPSDELLWSQALEVGDVDMAYSISARHRERDVSETDTINQQALEYAEWILPRLALSGEPVPYSVFFAAMEEQDFKGGYFARDVLEELGYDVDPTTQTIIFPEVPQAEIST